MPEALAVSGLGRERLKIDGAEPCLTLGEFSAWTVEVSGGAQPVMCGYPASYDWTFLYWYPLIRLTGANPFGLPLRAVAKGTMPRRLLSRRRHTHHALDDALEQAELLANLMRWPGQDGSAPGPG